MDWTEKIPTNASSYAVAHPILLQSSGFFHTVPRAYFDFPPSQSIGPADFNPKRPHHNLST
jgi:hypothetical protein